MKLLNYLMQGSYTLLWISPVQVVSKKGGITIVQNDKNELISTRTITGYKVFIGYRKLNNAIRKDHFSLPFIDQMLEKLVGHSHYYFLNGYSGYNQIPIAQRTKRIPLSLVHIEHLYLGICLLVYVMLLLHFNGA